jgi:hypothetical protein
VNDFSYVLCRRNSPRSSHDVISPTREGDSTKAVVFIGEAHQMPSLMGGGPPWILPRRAIGWPCSRIPRRRCSSPTRIARDVDLVLWPGSHSCRDVILPKRSCPCLRYRVAPALSQTGNRCARTRIRNRYIDCDVVTGDRHGRPKSQRINEADRVPADIGINSSTRHEFIVPGRTFPRGFSG